MVEWYIDGTLREDEQAIEEQKRRKGMFVIATNELDIQALTDRQLLEVYKDQSVTVEQRVRSALAEANEQIWDQKDKPTQRPTIRWVFMIFEDLLLLYVNNRGITTITPTNLREEHRIVLRCLGPIYEKTYFL